MPAFAYLLVGLLLMVSVLLDGFEVVILPRRVTRRFMVSRTFLRTTWRFWRAFAGHLGPRARDSYLSYFGPLALLILLSFWATGLIVAFACLHEGLGAPFSGAGPSPHFASMLYFSGVTFFTLGFGDLAPLSAGSRALSVFEGGMGFGFLALVIGYFPVLYTAFSQREQAIVLLDARAGSPPTAFELLRRHGSHMTELQMLLRDWEAWAAQLLESHISFPALCFYRSQHTNQSWLAALTTILDASSLIMANLDSEAVWQARLTFAMARHAVADLAQVLNAAPVADVEPRLTDEQLLKFRAELNKVGCPLSTHADFTERLAELRALYEPFTCALSKTLVMSLPPWDVDEKTHDNWQKSAWGSISRDALNNTGVVAQEHPM